MRGHYPHRRSCSADAAQLAGGSKRPCFFVVLAGGTAKAEDERISVEARRGDTRFGICSTTFLEQAFRTDYYRIDITFNNDDSWTYVTRTDLAVRGATPPFDHRDTNTLHRIAAPTPNPLFDLLKSNKSG